MNKGKLNYVVPFIILLALFGLFFRELMYAKQEELPSALVGEPIPNFELPTLYSPSITLTQKNLQGRASLLNIWATWCYACTLELPMLLKIKNEYHVPLYGITYKDKAEDAKAWLNQHGNPYILVGNDRMGDVAIDFGVYGTPETFVINPHGKIVYRHVGAIDQKVWDDVLYPLIKQYSVS